MISKDEILVQRRPEGNQLLYRAAVTVDHETLVNPDQMDRARTDPSFFVAQYLDGGSAIPRPATIPSASPELDRELTRNMQDIIHDRIYHETRRYMHELLQLAATSSDPATLARLHQIRERLTLGGLL